MRLPVSACLITRNEPLLEQAVASVRAWVAEICIVDASTGAFAETARRLADRYERQDDDCDDWAELRNRSFALASKPWVLWLDADDEVTGLDHLADALAIAELRNQTDGWRPTRIICPYEYSYDPDTGLCDQHHVRERIVSPAAQFVWERPAHESLVLRGGRGRLDRSHRDIAESRIVWKHRRPHGTRSGRSLAILKKHAESHTLTPRLHFDLGMEHAAAGDKAAASEHLMAFLKEGALPHERAQARLKLAAFCEANLDAAIVQVEGAHDECPCFATTLALARALLLKAALHGDEGARTGATILLLRAVDEEPGLVPFSEKDRSSTIFDLLHGVYTAEGEHDLARQTVDRWLRRSPNDPKALLRREDGFSTWISHLAALDIVIACPPTAEPWNPTRASRTGIGGSETAVMEMAKRLARKGHLVRVYGSCGQEGLYDGVEYREPDCLLQAGKCDVLVSWRDMRPLEYVDAKVKLVWAHDTHISGATHARALHADRILALSKWHKAHLCKTYALHPEHVHVTRNGIDVARFEGEPPPRNPHRAIYSSSPDRGLPLLLDLWPRIRAEVPDAELHVYSSFAAWEAAAAASKDAQHAYTIASCKRRLAELPGVTSFGRVDQKALANAMLGAGCWLYPAYFFTETSCISAMEAQAAGLHVVATSLGALPETVKHGTVVRGDSFSERWQSDFVEATVTALHGSRASLDYCISRPAPVAAVDRSFAAEAAQFFSWDSVADEWEALFHELLGGTKHGALPSFSGVLEAA